MLMFATFASNAQTNLLTENFDTFANLATAGWTMTNQSSPAGASSWAQGGGTAFATGGYNGGATSFALCNFNSTTGAGTISNWLMTPVVSLKDGDVIKFYSRAGGTGTGTVYADRLELRLSTTGAATVAPSGGSAGVGDYTTLALSINPDLTTTGYPFTWTQYTYTVTGLPTATDCKIAFRYFVTSGGPSGDNSNIVGIDALSVDRTLGTNEFFAKNFSVYPNPAKDNVTINSNSTSLVNDVQVVDFNGRVVKSIKVNATSTQINISDLAAGVYMLKATSDLGSGTAKIIKN